MKFFFFIFFSAFFDRICSCCCWLSFIHSSAVFFAFFFTLDEMMTPARSKIKMMEEKSGYLVEGDRKIVRGFFYKHILEGVSFVVCNLLQNLEMEPRTMLVAQPA